MQSLRKQVTTDICAQALHSFHKDFIIKVGNTQESIYCCDKLVPHPAVGRKCCILTVYTPSLPNALYAVQAETHESMTAHLIQAVSNITTEMQNFKAGYERYAAGFTLVVMYCV